VTEVKRPIVEKQDGEDILSWFAEAAFPIHVTIVVRLLEKGCTMTVAYSRYIQRGCSSSNR
jgi:hypothetical protein